MGGKFAPSPNLSHLTKGGRYYHETGHSAEATSFIEMAQEISMSLKTKLTESSSHSSTHTEKVRILQDIIAETHHNLGCIGTEVNRPDFTLKHFKIFNDMLLARSLDKQNSGDNRLAISWNELGNAYMMKKMWTDGEHCFKKSIITFQNLDDFKPIDLSLPLVNLGLTFWLTGRLDEAIDTLLGGLQNREAEYGPDDRQSFM